MIRPRSGNFIYSNYEIEIMEMDIDAIRASGLNGVVFGANLDNLKLNEKVLESKYFIIVFQGMGKTLHRCFDLVPDINEGIETAITLGFERILTSGFAKRAIPDGIPNLQKAVEISSGRISIMPGSGINSGNISELLKIKGIIEVHSSCSKINKTNNENNLKRLIDFGFSNGVPSRKTCANEVRQLKDNLKRN
uniref:Copper homeostasis protein cutC homolog n=1 Tax=Meloidogyne javanica TaxID=6303 RepID=A0A915M9R4_MELJA